MCFIINVIINIIFYMLTNKITHTLMLKSHSSSNIESYFCV